MAPASDGFGVEQGTAARETVQLGADYLAYARERFDALTFKNKLVERLLPTVPRKGDPRPVRSGQTFGKFEIGDRLGKGGMAFVYMALDPERATSGGPDDRNARVAIKVMKDEISHDPAYVKRFLREAANTALIEHPNVVSVYEVGSVNGRLYFTMELIEGITLKEHLRSGPLGEREGVQILCQLLDGIIAAHERGVAHRDLKPANVMVLTSQTRYGFQIEGEYDIHVKVTDFGLAHQLELDQSAVKPGGQFLGTAKYVAPEVIKGEEPTLKSDLFSLGILAFSLFAGQSPFRARNKFEYITANLEQEAPLLRERVDVSHALEAVVNDMLCKDPRKRPGAEALRKTLGRLNARNSTTIVASQARDAPPPGRRVRTDDGPADEGLPPAALQAIGALVGGVVVLALLFVVFSGSDPQPQPSPQPSASRSPELARKTPGPGASPTRPQPLPSLRRAGPLAKDVPLPSTEEFVALIERAQFPGLIKKGDRAWSAKDPRAARDAWLKAAKLLKGEPPAPLVERVKAGVRAVALVSVKARLERFDGAGALDESSRALEVVAEDAELLELKHRAEAMVADLARVKEELRRAAGLAFSPETRDQAVTLLRELLPVAERVGQQAEVTKRLEALGASPAPKATPTPTPSPVIHVPAEVRRFVVQADQFLRERSWDSAGLSINSVKSRIGVANAVVRVLERRLARGRATPAGEVILEHPAALHVLPKAARARRQPVTHGEFAQWLGEASGTFRPPRSWKGTSPPTASEKQPVTQVGAREARACAASMGKRLLDPHEEKLLREVLGADAVPGPRGDRYPGGFHVVSDVP